MRAAVFHENGGPEVVSVEEVETPTPAPGQVLVAVGASSFNHLDLWVRRGLPIETPMPHIGGSDIAGTVAAVGSEADDPWVGKRVVVDPSLSYRWYELAGLSGRGEAPISEFTQFTVIGEHTQGGFAEFVVVPTENLVELPSHVPFQTAAAAALTGVTALRGLLSRGQLEAGESVLITGASGGVASIAIQIAKLTGTTVHALTSSDENMERVRGLGADFAYDRRNDDWSKALYEQTGRRGVNLCLDSVGEAIWPQAMRALAVGGRIVSYGATAGHKASFDIRALFWRQLSILGSTMGTHVEFRRAMSLVFEGRIAPVVHTVLPLDEAARGHEILEAGGVFGKIVLEP
ncbi:MAG: zinc-binding dehydrogenase [Longimicrobiales bacterium]